MMMAALIRGRQKGVLSTTADIFVRFVRNSLFYTASYVPFFFYHMRRKVWSTGLSGICILSVMYERYCNPYDKFIKVTVQPELFYRTFLNKENEEEGRSLTAKATHADENMNRPVQQYPFLTVPYCTCPASS